MATTSELKKAYSEIKDMREKMDYFVNNHDGYSISDYSWSGPAKNHFFDKIENISERDAEYIKKLYDAIKKAEESLKGIVEDFDSISSC